MDNYQRDPRSFSSTPDQARGLNGRQSLPMHSGPPQTLQSCSIRRSIEGPWSAIAPPSTHPYGPTSPTRNGFGDGRGMPTNPGYAAQYQPSPQYAQTSSPSNGYPSPYAESSPGAYGQDRHNSVPYDPMDERPARRRRGNLPKWATDFLKQWFFEHIAHPYPTEQEKQELCKRTGLGMTQLSNWFINARRRQHPVLQSQVAAENMIRQGSNHTGNGEDREGLDGRPR
ncbi:uncharacterized protein KY384_003003 [Bacidia gigantensis]|uniref:uncharacterized protein n=1 Tax=Bacidia gigantensis TaxID=2732470 RepID=UPI001D059B89|nr:uncharacterized protein KY384_003003 [Bacidia gigantensis]KAG8531374.1 hypothetical protein KY384_003003 [Bacidia gigantensis]